MNIFVAGRRGLSWTCNVETTGVWWCVYVQRAQLVRLAEASARTDGSTTTTTGQSGPRSAPLLQVKKGKSWQSRRSEDGSAGCCTLLIGASSWPSEPNSTNPSLRSIFKQVSLIQCSGSLTCAATIAKNIFVWASAILLQCTAVHCSGEHAVLWPSDFGSLVKLDACAHYDDSGKHVLQCAVVDVAERWVQGLRPHHLHTYWLLG